MKKIFLLMVTLVLSFGAHAQTATTTGTGSGVASSSTGASTSGLVYSPTSNYAAVEQKPNSVFAPSFNNTATCVKGASFGIAFGGVQAAGGGAAESDWCQTIREAEVTYAIGGPVYGQQLAMEVLCSIERVRKARMLTGQPCAEDVAKAKQAAATPAIKVSADSIKDPIILARLKQ